VSLSSFVRRRSLECAAAHPHLDPWGAAWARTDKWDRQHANRNELLRREADRDRLEQAYELHMSADSEAAFAIWHALAEQGSVWAMIELGRCYEDGDAVATDLDMAEAWYERAFAGGSQIAMLDYAKLAARRGDYATCEDVLRVGVEQNWAPALFWLAWYRIKQSKTKQTYRAIRPMLKNAAAQGHPGAMMVLANFMVRGKYGLLRRPVGFLRLLRASMADVGNREAATG
jgi:TPR repeat protein